MTVVSEPLFGAEEILESSVLERGKLLLLRQETNSAGKFRDLVKHAVWVVRLRKNTTQCSQRLRGHSSGRKSTWRAHPTNRESCWNCFAQELPARETEFSKFEAWRNITLSPCPGSPPGFRKLSRLTPPMGAQLCTLRVHIELVKNPTIAQLSSKLYCTLTLILPPTFNFSCLVKSLFCFRGRQFRVRAFEMDR